MSEVSLRAAHRAHCKDEQRRSSDQGAIEALCEDVLEAYAKAGYSITHLYSFIDASDDVQLFYCRDGDHEDLFSSPHVRKRALLWSQGQVHPAPEYLRSAYAELLRDEAEAKARADARRVPYVENTMGTAICQRLKELGSNLERLHTISFHLHVNDGEEKHAGGALDRLGLKRTFGVGSSSGYTLWYSTAVQVDEATISALADSVAAIASASRGQLEYCSVEPVRGDASAEEVEATKRRRADDETIRSIEASETSRLIELLRDDHSSLRVIQAVVQALSARFERAVDAFGNDVPAEYWVWTLILDQAFDGSEKGLARKLGAAARSAELLFGVYWAAMHLYLTESYPHPGYSRRLYGISDETTWRRLVALIHDVLKKKLEPIMQSQSFVGESHEDAEKSAIRAIPKGRWFHSFKEGGRKEVTRGQLGATAKEAQEKDAATLPPNARILRVNIITDAKDDWKETEAWSEREALLSTERWWRDTINVESPTVLCHAQPRSAFLGMFARIGRYRVQWRVAANVRIEYECPPSLTVRYLPVTEGGNELLLRG